MYVCVCARGLVCVCVCVCVRVCVFVCSGDVNSVKNCLPLRGYAHCMHVCARVCTWA